MQHIRSALNLDGNCRWYHHSTHPTQGKPINPCVHNAPVVIFMQIYFLLLPGLLNGKLIYSHPIHAVDCLHLTFTSGTKETCYMFTQFSHQTEMWEMCLAFTERTSICIVPGDLLTVNNDRCIRIIMLLKHFEPELFAIFSFSVANNDGMISSGFVDPGLILMQCCTRLFTFGILHLLTNDRKMILNLF